MARLRDAEIVGEIAATMDGKVPTAVCPFCETTNRVTNHLGISDHRCEHLISYSVLAKDGSTKFLFAGSHAKHADWLWVQLL